MLRELPKKPSSKLGEAYAAYKIRVLEAAPAMRFVDTRVLDDLEQLAHKYPNQAFPQLWSSLAGLLSEPDLLAADEDKRAQFKEAYQQAEAAAYPGTTSFLKQCNNVSGLTQSHSLSAVKLETIRKIDLDAHGDDALAKLVRQMTNKLGEVTTVPDPQRYNQFFEIYGEAVVMLELRARGIKVRRVPEGAQSMPDFECETEHGKTFYIEVKSFDIVDGVYRHREMMLDALDSEVALERQRLVGKRIATSEREVAPYRRAGEDPSYDPRSFMRVIDTLRLRWRNTFKASQFKQGPTFALALLDRLVLPNGANDIAPYFYDDIEGGSCVSGVLWHSAFGTIGTPIFRYAEFAGKPNFDGHLAAAGVYADPSAPFNAVGMIVLDMHCEKRVTYGLAGPDKHRPGWLIDDTEEVLQQMCDLWNDGRNSRGWHVARKIV